MPDPDRPLHPLEWALAIILAVRWAIGGGA